MADNVVAIGPRRRGLKGIPPGLPYTALGRDEFFIYVLDSSNMLVRIPRNQISRAAIVGVWGEQQEHLYENYGRFRATKDGLVRIPRSIHTDQAADDMQRLAAVAGRFDPLRGLRGVGAWRGEDDDELILHLGDRLWIAAPPGHAPASVPLGRHGNHFYLRRTSVPPPHGRPVSAEPGNGLLGYLASWRWQRAIDPMLLLGLLAAGMLSGALEHRPQIDITGQPGVGKSGLQTAFRQILGDRMLYSADATAAGVRQRIMCDALVVGLDENESNGDPRRIADLQALRRASFGDGGDSLRGGVDHAPVTFPLRSIFLSSAVTLPPMDGAARSRGAVAGLLGHPNGELAYKPAGSARGMEVVGTMLLRRLADCWRRLDAEVIPAWRAILARHGFDGRASATYGTLLGCAHVLVSDAMPNERDYEKYATDLDGLAEEDKAERVPSYKRLLDYLFGQVIEPLKKSGTRMTVTILELICLAAGYGDTEARYAIPEAQAMGNAKTDDAAIEAHRMLRQLGMCITTNPGTGARLLAFSNTSPWLQNALKGTPFAALPGRAEAHTLTLMGAPGARHKIARFGHGTSRAVAVPLAFALAGVVGPNPERESEIWTNMLQGDPQAEEI